MHWYLWILTRKEERMSPTTVAMETRARVVRRPLLYVLVYPFVRESGNESKRERTKERH